MLNYTKNYKFVKPDESEFYDINVPNGNMDKVDAELKKLEDGKAPSGHGLGTKTKGYGYTDCIDILQYGCGFYSVDQANDRPNGTDSAWKPMIQIGTISSEGVPYGVQLLMSQNDSNGTNMWMRRITDGKSHDWVTMIHTGNATSILPFTRIKTGAYYGTGVHNANAPIVISADFKPRLLCINGVLTLPYGVTGLLYRNASNSTGYIHMTWEDSSVSFYFDTNYDSKLNAEGNAYFYALIG